MNRSSFAALGVALILFGASACGDKPPPKPPESTSDGGDSTSSTDTSGDGGGSTASSGDGGGDTKSTGDTPPPAAATLALPSGSAKLKFKQKKDFDLEVKSDGTVNSSGKPMGKITGMELDDKDGKAQLKVDGDGNITAADGSAYAKFDGDDLTSLTSWKFSIGDDGALSSTDDKGKKTALGKADGVGSAKKASLLVVAFAMWGQKAPAPAAKKGGDKPAGDKPPGKPGGKPGGKKP